MSVSTCVQSGFGTRRVRTWVAENCCKGSLGILRNAAMRQVKTCVAEDCCEGSSVILWIFVVFRESRVGGWESSLVQRKDIAFDVLLLWTSKGVP